MAETRDIQVRHVSDSKQAFLRAGKSEQKNKEKGQSRQVAGTGSYNTASLRYKLMKRKECAQQLQRGLIKKMCLVSSIETCVLVKDYRISIYGKFS